MQAADARIADLVRDVTGCAAHEVQSLTGGISNRGYLVRCAGPELVVVRVMGTREHARARASHEAAALRVVGATVVPAPRLLWRGHVAGLGWLAGVRRAGPLVC